MPLPSEGEPISFDDLNEELSQPAGSSLTLESAGYAFSLNLDEDNWSDGEPGLSMSEFYGGGATTTAAPGGTTTTLPPYTRYYTTPARASSTEACSEITSFIEFYLPGFSNIPEAGDILYTDEQLTDEYVGDSFSYIGLGGFNSFPAFAVQVDSNGEILTVTECAGGFTTTTTTLSGTTTTTTLSGLTGSCRFIFVEDSIEGSGVDTSRYGLQWFNPLLGTQQEVFTDLFGTSTTYNGVEGTVYSVCSTYSIQNLWDSATNTLVSIPSDVQVLPFGEECLEDFDCEYSTTSTTSTSTTTTQAPIQYTEFYVHTDGLGDANEFTACDRTTLSTPLYFTSSVGSFNAYVTNFNTLSTLEKRVYTDSALANPFNGSTTWYGADSTGPNASYAFLIQSGGDVGTVYTCGSSTTQPPTTQQPYQSIILYEQSGGGGWDNSTDACNGVGGTSVLVLYIDTGNSIQVGTTVYSDQNGSSYNGLLKWFQDQTTIGDQVIQIDASGQISNITNCSPGGDPTTTTTTAAPPPDPTTTTTTTAAPATTTTTAAPVFQSYLAERLDGLGGYIGPISQAYGINDLVIVDDGSGICWEIGDNGEQTAAPTYTIQSLCNTTTTTLAPITTTQPPVTLKSFQGSPQVATSGIACVSSATNTYGFLGAGTTPESGDTCYTSPAGGKFLPAGWYLEGGDLAALEIGSSGVVINKLLC